MTLIYITTDLVSVVLRAFQSVSVVSTLKMRPEKALHVSAENGLSIEEINLLIRMGHGLDPEDHFEIIKNLLHNTINTLVEMEKEVQFQAFQVVRKNASNPIYCIILYRDRDKLNGPTLSH